MNKTELVETVATHTGIAKSTVAEVLGGFEDVVVASVAAGEKVTVTGFVSFEQVQRKARTARNPQTGEPIQVKASKAPKVSIGATFKKASRARRRPRRSGTEPSRPNRAQDRRTPGALPRGFLHLTSVLGSRARRRACGPCGSPNFTTPSRVANSVSSPPRPTLRPGWTFVPRWRTRMRARGHRGAVEGLHAEALRVGVAAVAGGTATLGLGHVGSSALRAEMPVISTRRVVLTVAPAAALAGLRLVGEGADLRALLLADDRAGDRGAPAGPARRARGRRRPRGRASNEISAPTSSGAGRRGPPGPRSTRSWDASGADDGVHSEMCRYASRLARTGRGLEAASSTVTRSAALADRADRRHATPSSPSETRLRVISTSPSSEMSKTWVRVLSREQRVAQRRGHRLAVVLGLHVDEVDDDDPADVAQPQLAGDLFGRLEVVAEDRLFEVGLARRSCRC